MGILSPPRAPLWGTGISLGGARVSQGGASTVSGGKGKGVDSRREGDAPEGKGEGGIPLLPSLPPTHPLGVRYPLSPPWGVGGYWGISRVYHPSGVTPLQYEHRGKGYHWVRVYGVGCRDTLSPLGCWWGVGVGTVGCIRGR